MGQDHLEEITRPSTGDIDCGTRSELTDNTIFVTNLGVCERLLIRVQAAFLHIDKPAHDS